MPDLTSVANQAVAALQPAATQAATNPPTDVNGTIQMIAAVVVGVIAMAWPIMKLVRLWNSDRSSNSKDSAESFLYTHLKEQIEENKKDLAKSKEENERLWNMIRDLETRLKRLEDFESANAKLKIKLNEKDDVIRKKDQMIDELRKELKSSNDLVNQLYQDLRSRDTEIAALQDDIRMLKNRLADDEDAILHLQHDPPQDAKQ